MNISFIIIAFKARGKMIRSLSANFIGKNVEIIQNLPEKNLGFAGGANEGIKSALEKGSEWIVIVNQDIQATAQAVDDFCKKLGKIPAGVAGPFAGRFDQKRWTTILEGKNTNRFWTSRNDDTNFSYISGSFMAIHREVLKKIGGFFEPFFLYYEDADLCVRVQKAGFKLTYLPVKNISHRETSTLGKGSFKHEYYLARNHLLFVERNAPTAVKLHEFLRMPKTLWEYYKKGNRGALMGIRDYVLRRFGEYI